MIAKIKNIEKKMTVNKFINNKLSTICFKLWAWRRAIWQSDS